MIYFIVLCVLISLMFIFTEYAISGTINYFPQQKQSYVKQMEEHKLSDSQFQKLTYVEPVQSEFPHSSVIFADKTLPEDANSSFKSYMDYRKITYRNSIQYELQQSATTDEDGFRRYNGLYMIALGTYYSPVAGLEFEIEFCSGKIIHGITGDVKNDRHTDSTNRYSSFNKSVLEFITDTKKINRLSRIMGDMSYSNMEGEIVRITQIITIKEEE